MRSDYCHYVHVNRSTYLLTVHYVINWVSPVYHRLLTVRFYCSTPKLRRWFLPRDAMLLLAMYMLSSCVCMCVCLSVCVCVIFWYCVKTAKLSIKQNNAIR